MSAVVLRPSSAADLDAMTRVYSWLVLESAGQVLGHAYANQCRPRPAYRFCVEDSAYLAPEAVGARPAA